MLVTLMMVDGGGDRDGCGVGAGRSDVGGGCSSGSDERGKPEDGDGG